MKKVFRKILFFSIPIILFIGGFYIFVFKFNFYQKNQTWSSKNIEIYKNKLIIAHNLSKAKNKNEFLKFMQEWPQDLHQSESLRLFGLALIQNKKYNDAIKILNKSIKKLKKNELQLQKKTQIHFLIAKAYEQNNNLLEGINHNKIILKWFPQNILALSNIGHLYLKNKDVVLAKQFYEKAYKINKNFKSALSGLAKIAKKEEKLDLAKTYYHKLIKNYPNYAIYYSELSHIYFREKNMPKYYEYLAKTYFVSKRYKESIQYLKKINGLKTYKKLHELLIINLVQLKEFKKALQEIKLGLKFYNADISYKIHEANVFFLQKLFLKSVNVLKNILKQNIKNKEQKASIYILLGHNQMALKRNSTAAQYYEEALNINSNDIQTRERLAQIYRLEGNKNKEYFHQSIVYLLFNDINEAATVFSWISPKSIKKPIQYYYYKGVIFFKKNELLNAIKAFNNSLTFVSLMDHPYYGKNYMMLINIYTKMKNIQKLEGLKNKLSSASNKNFKLLSIIESTIKKLNVSYLNP